MSNPTEPKTVLVIDDEIDLQQLVKLALKSRGHVVETANNGFEGLKKLETLTPHLIILDLNMPKMGGLEFYQRICGHDNLPKYPILILTARANMLQLFKEFNIDGFMTKPFEIEELLSEVDAILEKKSAYVKKIVVNGRERQPRAFIVDNDPEQLKKIGAAFTDIGFVVSLASEGAEAIEKIHALVPDVALVKLALDEISGDIVILHLKRMAKTHWAKYILYSQEAAERTVIIDKISRKEGVDAFIQYSNTNQLTQMAKQLLNL